MNSNGKQLLVIKDKFKNPQQIQTAFSELCPDKEIDMVKRFDQAVASLKYYSEGKPLRKNGTVGIHLHMEYYKSNKSKLDISKWAQRNKSWVINYFGTSRETVLYSGWEATKDGAGMDFIFVPVDATGKINASLYIHSRSDLRRMQESYSAEMKKMCGLSKLPTKIIQFKTRTGIYEDTEKYTDNMNIPVQDSDESDAEYISRLKDHINRMRMSYEERLKGKHPETKSSSSESEQLNDYLHILSVYGNHNTICSMLDTAKKLQNGIKAYQQAGHPEIVSQVQKILGYGEEYMRVHNIK